VRVVTTGIIDIQTGLAVGVVPFIGRHRSRRDVDEATAGVRVPAGPSSRLPNVAAPTSLSMPRLLPRQPDIAIALLLPGVRRNEVVKDIDFAEPARASNRTVNCTFASKRAVARRANKLSAEATENRSPAPFVASAGCRPTTAFLLLCRESRQHDHLTRHP